MSNYRMILAQNHTETDTGGCTCGERPFKDCFVGAVLVPAMGIWQEMKYADIFANND